MTLCTSKHRKWICIYLFHIQKDYIINMGYVRLSKNLYIHHVSLNRNLYIHYVRLSTSYKKIKKIDKIKNLYSPQNLACYLLLGGWKEDTCTRAGDGNIFPNPCQKIYSPYSFHKSNRPVFSFKKMRQENTHDIWKTQYFSTPLSTFPCLTWGAQKSLSHIHFTSPSVSYFVL